jgi:hypothetical protein
MLTIPFEPRPNLASIAYGLMTNALCGISAERIGFQKEKKRNRPFRIDLPDEKTLAGCEGSETQTAKFGLITSCVEA